MKATDIMLKAYVTDFTGKMTSTADGYAKVDAASILLAMTDMRPSKMDELVKMMIARREHLQAVDAGHAELSSDGDVIVDCPACGTASLLSHWDDETLDAENYEED